MDSFQGIVITVSHDRYFLDRMVRRIFAFEGQGKISQYEGGYTDYQAACETKGPGRQDGGSQKPAKQSLGRTVPGKEMGGVPGQNRPKKLKFTYQEQKDWEVIEEEIQALEERLAWLDQAMEEAARDFVKLNELMKEKEDKETELERKMERWMYLNDLAEQIAAGNLQG